MISGSRGTPWEPGWVRGGHPSDGRCHSRSAQGVLASCQAPLAGNGTDQQGQLDERKAPELGGAWAPGECSGGGQGGDAAAWSPEGLPSQGAHPGWPGAAATPGRDPGYQEISEKCPAQHFLLGAALQPHN